MDHTEATYAAAELLHERFERVVVITPREAIAQATAMVTRQGILRRLHQKDIAIITLAEPRWNARQREISISHIYSSKVQVITDVAFFAYATPRVPNDELAEPLRAAGVEVHVAGDARNARGLMEAIAEGHAAGNAI